MPPRPATFALLVALGAGVLAGCDDGGEARMEARIRVAQAASDPPQLWSAQVVGETHNGRPVLICADKRLRSGFTSVNPAHGARNCARLGEPTTLGAPYRCVLDGTIYGVASTVVGDRSRDFQVGSTIRPLVGQGADYARTLRFRFVAERCPTGWNVGDTTDQQGRHVRDAVEMEVDAGGPAPTALPPEPLSTPLGLARPTS